MNIKYNFLIPEPLLKEFQETAKQEGKTESALLKELITERLKGDLRKRVDELEKRVEALEKRK